MAWSLYDFIISNIAVQTVPLLQKLMVYGLPCNVDRGLLTVQLSLLLDLKCDFSGTATFDVRKFRWLLCFLFVMWTISFISLGICVR